MVIFGYRFVVYRFCLIAVFYVERLPPTVCPLIQLPNNAYTHYTPFSSTSCVPPCVQLVNQR